MTTISEALAIAMAHHRAGRLAAAEQIYRRILERQPDQSDAWHLLGMVAQQAGAHAAAVDCLGQAVALRPRLAPYHLALGTSWAALGNFPQAAACCRRALQLKPDYPEAHNNLGNACLAQGELAEAIACYRQAVEIQPDFAAAHVNLGNALTLQGELDEAVACCREALRLEPDSAEAHYHLGNAQMAQGHLDEAAGGFRRAIELRPDRAEAYLNLGTLYQRKALWAEAAACYRQAIDRQPDFISAYHNLGAVLSQLGKHEEAVACCRRALELDPHNFQTYNQLGIAFSAHARPGEAIDCFRRALEIQPEYAEAHHNLGNALVALGKLDEALSCYRRALQLKPDLAAACNSLGAALEAQDKLDEALECYAQALQRQPDYAQAHTNRGNALTAEGRIEEARACHRRAVALRPEQAGHHSNLLLCEQYRPGVTAAHLAAAHADFDRRHAAPLQGTWQPHGNSRDPQRPLRLGFVSADLRQHPVGQFLVRTIEALRGESGPIACYSNSLQSDELTARIRAAADVWREVPGMSDETLAEQIRADGVDILFDLSGHTAGNRLLVFARKPAPIQITWIGYPGTTGLSAMDYILADESQIPAAAEADYRERVLRLPEGYVSYDPPADAPSVSPLPAAERGWATLASFSSPAKISPPVIEVWAEILRRLPQSRLTWIFRGLDCPSVIHRYAGLFAAQGIDPARVDLRGWLPHGELLAQYGQVDLALDPFPYSGGLTTCEALWMGVPVITWPGETFAGRHAVSHLCSVGLTETIAHDRQQYVELAVGLAGDPARLAALRGGLRQRMAASPLCDGPRLAGNLMALLRGVWRQWAKPGKDHENTKARRKE